MAEEKTQPKKKGRKKFPKGTVRKGYTSTSPAVCVVVHDLGGRPMPDRVANEIADAVTEKAVKYGYVVNITRQ